MNKFEDDLKCVSMQGPEEFLSFLQSLAREISIQREYSYVQDFLRLAGNFFELIFKPDGFLQKSFQATQQRFYLVEDTIRYVRILHQLSPNSNNDLTFYFSLCSQYPLNTVPQGQLPAHLQLFFKDRNVASYNPHFQQFQEIFKENIIEEKNQIKFCVSPQMLFWIYLLNGASNFKESAVDSSSENTQKFLDGVFAKQKKIINTKDNLLKQLAFNPYVVIIRRIIEDMITFIKHKKQTPNQTKQHTLVTFQQMIILLQEYTIYEYIFVTKVIDLNLPPDIERIFNKIKPTSQISDTQMMLIYLTIFYNGLNGMELESIYQQYKRFLKNSESIGSISSANIRGFFFECGRQQLVTYQQALYKLLENAFEVYPHQRLCTKVTLLSHISTYVLFLRGHLAKHELTLYSISQIYDQKLFQCLIQPNKQLIQLAQRNNNQYKGNNPVLKAIARELEPISSLLKQKFQESPESVIFRDFKPASFGIQETKFSQNENLLVYHYKELDQYRGQINNLVRVYYPFFTKLLISALKCISQLDYLNQTEHQGVIHLLTFMYSKEINSYFCGIVKSLPSSSDKSQQIPTYQEVKNFCDTYVKNSQDEDFCIKKQVTKEQITKILSLVLPVRNIDLIRYFTQTFEIQEQILKTTRKISSSPQKRQTRLANPRKSINRWKAPIGDNENELLFNLMWYFSLLSDKIRRVPVEEYPSTQWPRKFAQPLNLILGFIFLFLVFTFFRLII